nr:hypothetical protein [Tanacetum cinerariifolium]
MLSRISFHVLYGRPFKTLCFLNYALMIRQDYDITSSLRRGKEVDDKIKEGTLNLDDGTNAMTVVFGKEKGGYARGVGSGVTYKSNAYEVDETQSSVVRDNDLRIQKKSNGLVTSEKVMEIM